MNSRWKSTIESLPDVVKYLMVLGVIIFISSLFPNHAKFKYEFEKNKPWAYDDFYAPFDFAIKKSEDEINKERELAKKEVPPIYEKNTEVVKNISKRLEEKFSRELANQPGAFPDVRQNSAPYLSYASRFLTRIYDRGVIELDPQHQQEGEDFVISILTGNTTQQHTLENLYTAGSARQIFTDSLPYSRLGEPDFLLFAVDDLIVPNLLYNDTLTLRFLDQVIQEKSSFHGVVAKDELIVPRGGVVTEEIYQKLDSYRQKYSDTHGADKSSIGVFIGYFLLTSLIIGTFLLYQQLFFPTIFSSFSKLIFILLWLVVYSYLVKVVESTDILSSYLIPFCIAPIVIKTFYNERLALFTHVVIVLIASFLSSLGYEFTFLQILAGIVVILAKVDTTDWTRFFYALVLIFFTYALAYLGLSLIKEGTLSSIDWSVYKWLFMSIFLTLLANPLIPLLERFFGFTSKISLVEMSDMNRPLLRDLALKAPGTMQHSLQVANLSEEAARKIGADPLLVKVAALYHDVGKTANPEFFIENQSGKNPHDEISFLDSAKIIIGHVTEGLQMAKKARLPSVLTDFIRTHHGTTRVEYFYRNFVKENPDREFDETLFCYPGPKPRTKEETILMLADSIEAACKSLSNPTEKELTDFIDKIIAGKVTMGQLEDSTMSFKELEACTEVFKSVMKSIYHVRIEYPDEKK